MDNTEYKDNWRKQGLVTSIKNALRGIGHILNHHYNARLIFLFSVFAVLLGFYLQVSNLEMFVLGVAIIVLFISEVINTIIEDMINLITQEYHLKIKIIKDVAAGVVLVAVFFFAILCYSVFVKRIMIVWRSIDHKPRSEMTSHNRR